MPVIRVKATIKRPLNSMVVNRFGDVELKIQGNLMKGFAIPWSDYSDWETFCEQEVMIPDDIQTVAPYSFREDNTLLHLHLQHRNMELSHSAFYRCRNLKTADLADGTRTIPLSIFCDCISLESIYIPWTVERINMYAFKNCFSLKQLKLSSNLQVIESYAFAGCRSLQELILPEGLTEIGSDAFSGCTGLKKVILPESLTEIGSCAFLNCTSLEEIVIPAGITKLPFGVFAGCKSLRRVVLPDTLSSVSPYAFWKSEHIEIVENSDPEKHAQMFLGTPWFAQQTLLVKPVKPLPLHLADRIGPVSGAMLSAMGYPWFETGKKYSFHICEYYPWVIEVTARYADCDHPADFRNDWMLMTTDLEPIDGLHTCFALSDAELQKQKYLKAWAIQKAAYFLDPEMKELYDEALCRSGG